MTSVSTKLNQALREFSSEHEFDGKKGPLSVAIVVTQHAREMGLPLDPAALLTDGGGQVHGLGKAAVQVILKRHGIDRVLAQEGGRTSRGSINKMKVYVDFLNRLDDDMADLEVIEAYWISRVNDFFAGKPLRITLDATRSLTYVVRDILTQAAERQVGSVGIQHVGAVLQHLVGAKLDCVLGPDALKHNSFSTADASTGRVGDFALGDVAIHVTTFPGEAVIERCHVNIDGGLRPILVTLPERVDVARGIAEQHLLKNRLDIFDIEQFVALNLYEMGEFGTHGRRAAIEDFIARYNAIVEEVETDPSLQIEIRA